MLKLTARAAFAGALGGVAAGILDFSLALPRLGAFLPTGRARLLVFLVAEYGAALGTLAGLTALFFAIIGRATDLGGLWRSAFGGAEPEGRRLSAYAAAAVIALPLHGYATRLGAVDALQRFRHRGLIAALVGAEAAGLWLAAAVLVLLLAAALSPLVRVGPRARLAWSAPAAPLVAAWVLALFSGAGAVAAMLFSLEARPRMTPPLKALNTGLWAPLIFVAVTMVGHLGARRACRGWRGRRSTPGTAALALLLAIAVPLAIGGAVFFSTVRQLDLRPFVAMALALPLALGLSFAVARLPAGCGLLPLLLLLVMLIAGRSDRVRKAAVAFTGATGPIVAGLHSITDLDRDGYSSILGGGDCNDLDRDVHPGAFDWPDDGIDQDCNGHEATLSAAARPAFASVPPSVPRSPNVLLLTIDALRADHVGSYGYARPTTPNLDRLAEDAVRFQNAWAHAPSTRYSVPAILAGRYPSTIAVNNDPRVHWPPQVLPENHLIAEILKSRGFHTGAILSYHYFERGWGLDQGFDDYDISLEHLHSMGGDPAATSGSSARQLADADIAYLEKHKDERIFLWSHYYDTHFRFEPHPDLPAAHFGEDELSLYDGEIRYTDEQLGRVFDALKRLQLWDNTIILITADHGDGFGEHGIPPNQRHGYHLYANETKVPLIIRVPGVAPRVVDTPVGHVDILPTILNLVGGRAEDEPQLFGQSALDLMLGGQRPGGRVYQEVWYEGPTSRKAVVTPEWHLIRNLVPDDTTELYDLKHDPLEEHDVSGGGEAAEAELTSLLGAWMDEVALPPDFEKRVRGNVSTAPFSVATPLGDTIGGLLRVEGMEVKTDRPMVGGPLEVVLYLHALGRVPEGWRLFTHLTGPQGQMINADHEPLEGTYPVSRLRSGTWLRDRVATSVPAVFPAGPVTVEVGLWRGQERMPVDGPHARGGAVRAGTIMLQPRAAPRVAP
jgi:arylsulfatase A-like enzyme